MTDNAEVEKHNEKRRDYLWTKWCEKLSGDEPDIYLELPKEAKEKIANLVKSSKQYADMSLIEIIDVILKDLGE